MSEDRDQDKKPGDRVVTRPYAVEKNPFVPVAPSILDILEMEKEAARRFWNLMTAPIERVGSFGQRLLFHLPCCPMAAYKWGLAGGPVDLEELRGALDDTSVCGYSQRRSHAREVLYNYLADYSKVTERLGAQPRENRAHLLDLAGLLLDIRSNSTKDDDPREVIPAMISMLDNLLDAAGAEGPVVETLRNKVT